MLLAVLSIPAIGMQSAFDINQPPFGQILVALFGQFAPGGNGKPFRFLFAFSLGRGLNPVRSHSKRGYRSAIGSETHLRFAAQIADYHYFIQAYHCFAPLSLLGWRKSG